MRGKISIQSLRRRGTDSGGLRVLWQGIGADFGLWFDCWRGMLGVSQTLVDELKMKTRVSLVVSVEVKTAAQAMAAKQGVSLNKLVVMALARKVSAAAFFAVRGIGGDAERAVVMLRRMGE